MKFGSRRKPKPEPKMPKYVIALQLEVQLDPDAITEKEAAEVVLDDLTERLHKWLNRGGWGSHRFRATTFEHDEEEQLRVLAILLAEKSANEPSQPPSITIAKPGRTLH